MTQRRMQNSKPVNETEDETRAKDAEVAGSRGYAGEPATVAFARGTFIVTRNTSP